MRQYVRLCATRRLALLLLETPVTPDWQIRLLLTQLYDPSPEVTQLAVEMLERLCESNETLEAVVRMRPSLDHLGEVGGILLTRYAIPISSVSPIYAHSLNRDQSAAQIFVDIHWSEISERNSLCRERDARLVPRLLSLGSFSRLANLTITADDRSGIILT